MNKTLLEHINKMTEKQKTATAISLLLIILGKLDSEMMMVVQEKILQQETN